MKNKFHRIVILFLIITSLVICINSIAEARPSDVVYRIPVTGTINPGLLNFITTNIKEAEKLKADAIILEIDTYGGLVDSAIKIRDLIFDTDIRTITYVSNRAWSAGALIALTGEKLVMAPGSSIGAAETRPQEEKYISALRKEFKATAERRNKNADIAAAMVDSDIEIEGIINKGKLLTLTAKEAHKNNIADLIAEDIDVIINNFNLDQAQIINVELSSSDKLSTFVTNPNISVMLLTIGFIALVIEVLAPGWGIGGTISLISLGLFFSGYIINGGVSWGLIILFLVGIALILLEIFVVPGFGVTGIGGLIAIFSSLFFLFPTPELALSVLATVMILSIAGIIVAIKYFGTSRLWGKISLQESQTREAGYVAHLEKRKLLGSVGETVTPLRPAGTIIVDDKRLDVVSEGSFITKNKKVEIVEITGSRIVVREIKEESD